MNTKMKDIDWSKVDITDEVVEYVKHKYGKYNFMEDNQIIFEDIYNTFFKDEAEADEEAELAKDDKRKGKMDDKGKRKVDDKEKAKSKLMVFEKRDLLDVKDPYLERLKKLKE